MARPRSPLLSVERITTEAIAMTDDGQPLSIVQLGRRLGVNPSSLYNHVSGRDEIIELMRGRLADDFQIVVPPGSDWPAVVEYVARRQRAMFAAHPFFLPLLVSQTVTDVRVISYYEVLATALAEAGLPDAQILDVIAMLDAFALGSGLDLGAPTEVWRTPDESSTLGRLLSAADDGVSRGERAFERGLRSMIDALHRDLQAAVSSRTAGMT